MSTRNIRTAEYKSYNDPELAGLKLSPTYYGIPANSGAVLTDVSGTTVVSAVANVVPALTTSTSTPATSDNPVGEIDTLTVGKWLRLTHEYDTTYNLKTGFPRNSIIMGVQAGVGKVTFECPFGTISPVSGYLAQTRGVGAVFAIIHIGSNIWDIMGDLEKAT